MKTLYVSDLDGTLLRSDAKIPIITYNGAVILQNDTFEIIAQNAFCQNEKEQILSELLRQVIYPIVYAYISGKEKFSYNVNKCNRATSEFLLTRKGDVRDAPVEFDSALGNNG